MSDTENGLKGRLQVLKKKVTAAKKEAIPMINVKASKKFFSDAKKRAAELMKKVDSSKSILDKASKNAQELMKKVDKKEEKALVGAFEKTNKKS